MAQWFLRYPEQLLFQSINIELHRFKAILIYRYFGHSIYRYKAIMIS